ncbi:MAG: AbrB/MazE/SpoVT family DNA-binding domain-containing protein [Bacillota bacterium]|nr:AbrB/MazE/SpoVT family DNA-binding domain-containing protein [Bacillota bacterium]MDI7250538.1 AbrB/MazE/SpoVT family DNA-binding domain-containing protein [Bacillota bacterium]
MVVKVSKKGQVTLPSDVRKHLGLRPGSFVRFVLEDGDVRLVSSEKGIGALKGSVQVEGAQDFKLARHRAMEEAARERSARTRR